MHLSAQSDYMRISFHGELLLWKLSVKIYSLSIQQFITSHQKLYTVQPPFSRTNLNCSPWISNL